MTPLPIRSMLVGFVAACAWRRVRSEMIEGWVAFAWVTVRE